MLFWSEETQERVRDERKRGEMRERDERKRKRKRKRGEMRDER